MLPLNHISLNSFPHKSIVGLGGASRDFCQNFRAKQEILFFSIRVAFELSLSTIILYLLDSLVILSSLFTATGIRAMLCTTEIFPCGFWHRIYFYALLDICRLEMDDRHEDCTLLDDQGPFQWPSKLPHRKRSYRPIVDSIVLSSFVSLYTTHFATYDKTNVT